VTAQPEKFGWKALAINLFLLYWLLGMASILSSGGCFNKPDPSTKLKFCNFAITAGFLIPQGQPGLHFQRAKILSQLDRDSEAFDEFLETIRLSQKIKRKRSSLRRFIELAEDMDDEKTYNIWLKAFSVSGVSIVELDTLLAPKSHNTPE